ncbi:Outer membrane protein assembly factor BamC [Zhongshania aliphaticivorans]|uniref:Outer membrane protein assembly factor BamC n=2 Tax=Zhongshania aliphaticivorans TaxID=1470434 RepID=A0A5S9N7V1_9GAMM|nr:Outer membrane protein assembly factor BamC [Zhongshania aliphaticivorans]CAA0086058.1 Outer membrane protein assembly factor BamC [Zhongshania aliphaticivorans]
MRSNGFRLTVMGLVLAILSGCFGGGVFRDRGQDYRSAKLSAPLELPPGVESQTLDDQYVVPGIQTHKPLPGEFEVQPPEPLAKNVGTAEVKIQTLDDHSWILLDGDPNQVWPRMRIFLGRAGLDIAKADGESAIIETEWRDPNGDGASRERFRFRLEEGVQKDTSEIHVLVQINGNEEWPQTSDNAKRESQMVRVVAQYLADQETAGSVSILAQRSDGKGKIFIEGGEDSGPDSRHLRLLLPVDRAWAALGLALVKAGFEIEDDRREVNKYWLTYVDPEAEQPGWFARTFGARRNGLSRYVVEMQEVGPEEARIYLNYQKGRRLREAEREKLLTRIMGYLY